MRAGGVSSALVAALVLAGSLAACTSAPEEKGGAQATREQRNRRGSATCADPAVSLFEVDGREFPGGNAELGKLDRAALVGRNSELTVELELDRIVPEFYPGASIAIDASVGIYDMHGRAVVWLGWGESLGMPDSEVAWTDLRAEPARHGAIARAATVESLIESPNVSLIVTWELSINDLPSLPQRFRWNASTLVQFVDGSSGRTQTVRSGCPPHGYKLALPSNAEPDKLAIFSPKDGSSPASGTGDDAKPGRASPPDLTQRAIEPTLGREWAPSQEGYGFVRPDRIFNGGDPTGLVTDVTWESWGDPKAIGHGTGWRPSEVSVADGAYGDATVVAFDLGSCDDTLMYRAIAWYFPEYGETFDPNSYVDICSGEYVGL